MKRPELGSRTVREQRRHCPAERGTKRKEGRGVHNYAVARLTPLFRQAGEGVTDAWQT